MTRVNQRRSMVIAAGLAALAELIFRTRLALGVGAMAGCLGMFLTVSRKVVGLL